jgi:hypothetical protein
VKKTVLSLLTSILLMLPGLGFGQAPAPVPAPPLPPKPCPCENCKDCSLEAPETMKVWVDRASTLTIKCEKTVTFIPADEDDDIGIVPSFVNNTFSVTAYAEGTFTLVAVVACKGEVKYAKIKVVATRKGKPDPKPVPPGPGPAPVPVPPADPLTKELQNAYALDSTADKANQVQALAALYKTAIPKVASAETGSKLLADLKAVAAEMKIPDAALPLVRSRIGVELKKVLVAGTLTDAQKAQVKELFGKLADGLAACK